MRVAYLSTGFLDPEEPRSWSGLPYFMRKALEDSGVETITVPLADSPSVGRWIRFLAWRILRRRRYLRCCDTALLRHYARQLEYRLPQLEVDAVFSPSTWLFAYAQTSVPIVFWTDACFASMLDFYPAFTAVAEPSVRAGHMAEQGALDRCAKGLYSSEWAASATRANYRVAPSKLGVVPFGGNLQEPPSAQDVAAAIDSRGCDGCRMLFVGVDWDRKGAAIAVDALARLRARGLRATLTVVGCKPPFGTRLPEGVEVVPFISKRTAEGRRRLDELYRNSHFFIMPSRAEAYGLVFSEAAAFGVPSLATDVGGLGSVIVDEVNGRLFRLSDDGGAYADYVASVMADPPRYRALAQASAEDARRRLMWGPSGVTVAEILADVVRRHPREEDSVVAASKGVLR